MKIYALDTNIVSYILKGRKNFISKLDAERKEGTRIIIPPIVYYETKRWLIANIASAKIKAFEQICSYSGIGSIDKDCLEIAASIYAVQQKQGKTTDDADTLIAAYCIQHGFFLVTNNVKHFEHIENLQLVNW
jgi:predicted nucleic acid-binding protein